MRVRRCGGPVIFLRHAALLVLLAVAASTSYAQGKTADVDLTELSIEQLMEVEVMLADRKPRKLSETSAAVFVVTEEDIRRSGATCIPEALRMVPGVQVARIGSGKWAVTSRGFNSRFAFNLLVLIDGRTVYTPVFSGVFWEVQDILMEDIDRIEIIRGPGASLWGANAVNGIVNVITKSAKETQGALATGGAGTEERAFGGARYGGQVSDRGHYRIYAKYFERDDAVFPDGSDAGDDWDMFRAGFRTDLSLSGKDDATVQGDLYSGERRQVFVYPTVVSPYEDVVEQEDDMSGANVLGRWRRQLSNGSDMALQVYLSHAENTEYDTDWDEDVFDIDFQHHFAFGKTHELTWGLGYRWYSDDIRSTDIIAFDPPEESEDLFSAFLQDDIELVEDRLRLTLGSKLEHNDATGFEIQPNARILWTPGSTHVFWAAVSRAVKVPSRTERSLRLFQRVLPPFSEENPWPFPAEAVFFGNPDSEPEEVIALEAGYRALPAGNISLDIALFYNFYDHFIDGVLGDPSFRIQDGAGVLTFPVTNETRLEAETWGAEVALAWEPSRRWRLRTAYSFFQEKIHEEDGFSLIGEDSSPRHQMSILSCVDLPGNLEWDLWFRYVDELSARGIDAYATLDMRVGWKPIRNLEISVTGQNLLDPEHPEFYEGALLAPRTEIERGVYAKFAWRY